VFVLGGCMETPLLLASRRCTIKQHDLAKDGLRNVCQADCQVHLMRLMSKRSSAPWPACPRLCPRNELRPTISRSSMRHVSAPAFSQQLAHILFQTEGRNPHLAMRVFLVRDRRMALPLRVDSNLVPPPCVDRNAHQAEALAAPMPRPPYVEHRLHVRLRRSSCHIDEAAVRQEVLNRRIDVPQGVWHEVVQKNGIFTLDAVGVHLPLQQRVALEVCAGQDEAGARNVQPMHEAILELGPVQDWRWIRHMLTLHELRQVPARIRELTLCIHLPIRWLQHHADAPEPQLQFRLVLVHAVLDCMMPCVSSRALAIGLSTLRVDCGIEAGTDLHHQTLEVRTQGIVQQGSE